MIQRRNLPIGNISVETYGTLPSMNRTTVVQQHSRREWILGGFIFDAAGEQCILFALSIVYQ